jgi:hypothetical protein
VAELEHADRDEPGGGADQGGHRLAPCDPKLGEGVDDIRVVVCVLHPHPSGKLLALSSRAQSHVAFVSRTINSTALIVRISIDVCIGRHHGHVVARQHGEPILDARAGEARAGNRSASRDGRATRSVSWPHLKRAGRREDKLACLLDAFGAANCP